MCVCVVDQENLRHQSQWTWGPQYRERLCLRECSGQVGLGWGTWMGQDCLDGTRLRIAQISAFSTYIRPRVQLCVHHPSGPCTPPPPSCVMGMTGERPDLLRFVLFTMFWPLGWGEADMGSVLVFLQQPPQGLSDAQEVDYLGNTQHWGNVQCTTVCTFKEG